MGYFGALHRLSLQKGEDSLDKRFKVHFLATQWFHVAACASQQRRNGKNRPFSRVWYGNNETGSVER